MSEQYDFSECKDYFIVELFNYIDVTILVNEAITLGYHLVNRDNYIVEMSKNYTGVRL